jgi:DAHP synthetase I family/SPFH domain / Band 7 family/Mitochondrial carrier protein
LRRYAVLLTGDDTAKVAGGRGPVQHLVKGIIEGETRSIVSTMKMEELFKERRVFRDKVIKNLQSELDQFGLKIYNANVKELEDTPGSECLGYLPRKAHEGPLNQVKVQLDLDKPGTTVGWKDLINGMDSDNSFNVNKGLRMAKEPSMDPKAKGVPLASEMLHTVYPQFRGEPQSVGAIGARTTESQLHQEPASGMYDLRRRTALRDRVLATRGHVCRHCQRFLEQSEKVADLQKRFHEAVMQSLSISETQQKSPKPDDLFLQAHQAHADLSDQEGLVHDLETRLASLEYRLGRREAGLYDDAFLNCEVATVDCSAGLDFTQAKDALKDIALGSAAGMMGKFIEYPFDTVKVRLQSQPDHLPLRTDEASGSLLGLFDQYYNRVTNANTLPECIREFRQEHLEGKAAREDARRQGKQPTSSDKDFPETYFSERMDVIKKYQQAKQDAAKLRRQYLDTGYAIHDDGLPTNDPPFRSQPPHRPSTLAKIISRFPKYHTLLPTLALLPFLPATTASPVSSPVRYTVDPSGNLKQDASSGPSQFIDHTTFDYVLSAVALAVFAITQIVGSSAKPFTVFGSLTTGIAFPFVRNDPAFGAAELWTYVSLLR